MNLTSFFCCLIFTCFEIFAVYGFGKISRVENGVSPLNSTNQDIDINETIADEGVASDAYDEVDTSSDYDDVDEEDTISGDDDELEDNVIENVVHEYNNEGHIMSNVGEPCGTGDMKFIGTCKEGLQCSDGWCDNATIAYESDAGDANDKKDRRWLSSYRYYNWMSRVSSSKKLSEMSIPGTHDSMTGDTSIGSHTNWCTKIPVNTCCACQSASLWSQLASGIRFLDIRLRCYNNKMWLYHGSISLGMDFKSVLSTIRKFLRYYPTETVLMSYQKDHADYNCRSGFKRVFQSELGSYKIYTGTKSRITLGNARGKIVPMDFKRNGGKGLTSPTNWWKSTLENDWEDVTRRMYSYKISLEGNLQESMGKTSSTYKTVFFITYFSANDCAYFPYGTKGPSYIARRVNPNLQNWIYWKNRSLRGSGRTNYGIVAMDFPSRYLTGQILQNN